MRLLRILKKPGGEEELTLNMSRLAWCRRSSGRGVVRGLDASLSDRMMTSGDGVLLSSSLYGETRNREAES